MVLLHFHHCSLRRQELNFIMTPAPSSQEQPTWGLSPSPNSSGLSHTIKWCHVEWRAHSTQPLACPQSYILIKVQSLTIKQRIWFFLNCSEVQGLLFFLNQISWLLTFAQIYSQPENSWGQMREREIPLRVPELNVNSTLMWKITFLSVIPLSTFQSLPCHYSWLVQPPLWTCSRKQLFYFIHFTDNIFKLIK